MADDVDALDIFEGKPVGQIITETIGEVMGMVIGFTVRKRYKDFPLLDCYRCGRYVNDIKGVVYSKRHHEPMHGKCWRREKDERRLHKKIRKRLRRLNMTMHKGAFYYMCDLEPRLTLRQRVGLLDAIAEGAELARRFDPHVFFEAAICMNISEMLNERAERERSFEKMLSPSPQDANKGVTLVDRLEENPIVRRFRRPPKPRDCPADHTKRKHRVCPTCKHYVGTSGVIPDEISDCPTDHSVFSPWRGSDCPECGNYIPEGK